MATRRLEAFSDAVFAIAITLLTLNLRVPVLSTVTPEALAAELAARWPTYLSFVLSFVTLLIAWVYHHRLLEAAKHAGTGLLFSNGILLLVVASVPFPTALLGAYLTTPAASVVSAIYAGYIGVLNLTYNLLWWVVVRQQRSEHGKGFGGESSAQDARELPRISLPRAQVTPRTLLAWEPLLTPPLPAMIPRTARVR